MKNRTKGTEQKKRNKWDGTKGTEEKKRNKRNETRERNKGTKQRGRRQNVSQICRKLSNELWNIEK